VVGQWLVEGLSHLEVEELLGFEPSGWVQSHILPEPARVLDIRDGRALTSRFDDLGRPVVGVVALR